MYQKQFWEVIHALEITLVPARTIPMCIRQNLNKIGGNNDKKLQL